MRVYVVTRGEAVLSVAASRNEAVDTAVRNRLGLVFDTYSLVDTGTEDDRLSFVTAVPTYTASHADRLAGPVVFTVTRMTATV